MSEWTLSYALVADSAEGFAEVKALQDAINEQARQWKIDRNTLLREVREGFMLISSLMSSFRQAMSLIGAQMDPFFSALVGMVLSTTSMLISAATVLTGTGIGAAVGAVLFGLAIAFNLLTLAKLVADKEEIQQGFKSMMRDLRATSARQAERGPRTVIAGGF